MDFKSGNGLSNKNSLDSEKSFLDNLEARYKNNYFWALFVLLKEEDSSMIFSVIGALISFLQLMIYPFHSNLIGIWKNDSIVKGISYVTHVAEGSYFLKESQWNAYVIIFYVLLFFLIFVKANLFYVSYSFSKKTFSFMWPVYSLWALCSLFSTILFYPVLDIFLSVLTCTKATADIYVNAYFPSVECWKGDHVLHAIFGIIAAILFLETNFVVSLCYYECKSTANVPTARANARANFIITLYHAIMILSFVFMRGEDYHYILLIFILGGSLLIFFKFHFNSPYYNLKISKLWSCIVAINLWTAIMLCFAKFMEGSLFEGTIIAWLIGIPFILLIVLTNRDHRVDLLLVNVNKFQSGDELQNQIRFILKLINWQTTNKNAAILLDGYVEIHKQTCNKDDCPLKSKNGKGTTVKNNKNIQLGSDDAMSDKMNLLVKLLDRMYYYGIKKFPNNTSLRISYAFFLIEKTDSKQVAVHELTTAEQNKPPFDEQFVIFRYRKLIDDELAETKTEGNTGLDAMGEQTFQNHLRQFQANIEKSSMLHMEFWSQLGEDNPDLNKLNELGVKIHHSITNVEDHWQKLQKISNNAPKAMKLYGKFLTDITNDKERGEELLEKARNIININSNKKNTAINFSGNEEIGDNSTATIFISGDTEKIGIINNANIACSSLFGYTKSELINRNIKILMPQMFSKSHDLQIETYNQTQEMHFIDKERFVFGKHKSYYIFPVFVNVRAINNGQNIQFAGTFRIDKFFKNIGYFLTLPSGVIDGISSSCISLLNVDLDQTRKSSSIVNYFPSLLEEAAKPNSVFKSTAGGELEYQVKDDDDNKKTTTVHLQCHISEISVSTVNGPAGYVFKLEQKNNGKPLGSRKHRPSTFQFRYNLSKHNLVGEFTDRLVEDLLSDGDFIQTNIENSNFINTLPHFFRGEDPSKLMEEAQEKRVNYSEGVRTMYLRDGKAVEMFGEDEEEENFEEGKPNDPLKSQQDPSKINKNMDLIIEDLEDGYPVSAFESHFKTRQQLKDVLAGNNRHPTLHKLGLLGSLFQLVIVATVVLNYSLGSSKLNRIRDNVSLINLSYRRVSEVQNIVAKSRDLFLLQAGMQPYQTLGNDSVGLNAGLVFVRDNLTVSSNALQDIERELQLKSKNLVISDINNILVSSNGINMQSQLGGNKSYDINEATRQLVTMAINLKDGASLFSTDDYMMKDASWYFITQNGMNDYSAALFKSSNGFVEDLSLRADSADNVFLWLLLYILIFIVVTSVLSIPIMARVTQDQQAIIALFLYLNENGVKQLYSKCEKLISSLQVGDDDDAASEEDNASIDKENNKDATVVQTNLGRRRRKGKINWRTTRMAMIISMSINTVYVGYFIYNYFLMHIALMNTKSVSREINATMSATSFFFFTANTQNMMILNSSMPVLGRNSEDIVKDNINSMFELDSTIHEEHSINVGIHSEAYKEAYNNLMMLKPCAIMASLSQHPYNAKVGLAECTAFASGTLAQGLALGLARHYENMRNMYSKYLQIVPSADGLSSAFTSPEIDDCLGRQTAVGQNYTQLRRKRFCLLEATEALEIDTMLFVYIRNLLEYLVNQLYDQIDSILDELSSTRLVLMACIIVFQVLAALLIYEPMNVHFKSQYLRVKAMLLMIPRNMIRDSREVRHFVRKCMLERGPIKA